jgi:hypothetical protein
MDGMSPKDSSAKDEKKKEKSSDGNKELVDNLTKEFGNIDEGVSKVKGLMGGGGGGGSKMSKMPDTASLDKGGLSEKLEGSSSGVLPTHGGGGGMPALDDVVKKIGPAMGM